jgi:hypothetical protein
VGRQSREVTSKKRVFRRGSRRSFGLCSVCSGVVAGKEDLNSITGLEQGGSRAERKKSLNVWNLRPLAIAMAEIVKI